VKVFIQKELDTRDPIIEKGTALLDNEKAGPWGFEPQSLAPKAKRIIQTTLRAQQV
jgi:hypothetical protein